MTDFSSIGQSIELHDYEPVHVIACLCIHAAHLELLALTEAQPDIECPNCRRSWHLEEISDSGPGHETRRGRFVVSYTWERVYSVQEGI